MYENLKPGALVITQKNQKTQQSSLGHFVYKNEQLYFTVALHAADITSLVFYNNVVVGEVVEASNNLLDTVLVLVNQDKGIVEKLVEQNFVISETNSNLNAVWDPKPIITEAMNAQSFDAENVIKAKTMLVSHSGQKLNSTMSNPQYNGEIVMWGPESSVRRSMTKRTTYPGDSGGPVFNEKNELVGFISMGGNPNESTQTDVVLAEYILTSFKCNLATWSNRTSWGHKT